MINLELFPCSGGMAEGFRRAGITFDLAIELVADHCDSYERNLGHRPVQMDARDFLRLVQLGTRPEVDLLVADPPCTPWSHAGKQRGLADERDMLLETCELIALLRPRRYLIGNVPGLDDSNHWPVVQRVIGGLARYGYCVRDYLALDAADYGVPQHRVRPFWYGHREGPCWRPPAPTHCDPVLLATSTLPGFEQLRPWVTCRQALVHLSLAELGRPVRLRHRTQNSEQHGSVADRPARVVGTSNLSDGNVIVNAPTLVISRKHAPTDADAPSSTVSAKARGNGAQVIAISTKHPGSHVDEPAMTVRDEGGGDHRVLVLDDMPRRKRGPSPCGPQWSRANALDEPAATVLTDTDRAKGNSPKLEWPFLEGDHDGILLSERATCVLQGFPEGWAICGDTKKTRWSQIGQAMPPALAEAVARAIVEQDRSTSI